MIVVLFEHLCTRELIGRMMIKMAPLPPSLLRFLATTPPAAGAAGVDYCWRRKRTKNVGETGEFLAYVVGQRAVVEVQCCRAVVLSCCNASEIL